MSTSIDVDDNKNDSKLLLQGKDIQETVAKWMEENMVFYKTNMVENIVDIVVSHVENEHAPPQMEAELLCLRDVVSS
jgi:hypothetical protein